MTSLLNLSTTLHLKFADFSLFALKIYPPLFAFSATPYLHSIKSSTTGRLCLPFTLASQTALHFVFCLTPKVLPFVCLLLQRPNENRTSLAILSLLKEVLIRATTYYSKILSTTLHCEPVARLHSSFFTKKRE